MPEDNERDQLQVRVEEALQNRSPKLASMYRAAHSALGMPAAPGDEVARISVICHCMRELMIGLPNVMTDSATPRPKPSATSLANRLPEILTEHPDLDLLVDQDLVPVPKQVARAVSELISTVAIERGLKRRNDAELITGGSDTKHPVLRQWQETYEFFLRWAHLDRSRDHSRELPIDDVLLANIRVVEEVIEVRTAQFFDVLQSLQDLLDEANAVQSGGSA